MSQCHNPMQSHSRKSQKNVIEANEDGMQAVLLSVLRTFRILAAGADLKLVASSAVTYQDVNLRCAHFQTDRMSYLQAVK